MEGKKRYSYERFGSYERAYGFIQCTMPLRAYLLA